WALLAGHEPNLRLRPSGAKLAVGDEQTYTQGMQHTVSGSIRRTSARRPDADATTSRPPRGDRLGQPLPLRRGRYAAEHVVRPRERAERRHCTGIPRIASGQPRAHEPRAHQVHEVVAVEAVLRPFPQPLDTLLEAPERVPPALDVRVVGG